MATHNSSRSNGVITVDSQAPSFRLPAIGPAAPGLYSLDELTADGPAVIGLTTRPAVLDDTTINAPVELSWFQLHEGIDATLIVGSLPENERRIDRMQWPIVPVLDDQTGDTVAEFGLSDDGVCHAVVIVDESLRIGYVDQSDEGFEDIDFGGVNAAVNRYINRHRGGAD